MKWRNVFEKYIRKGPSVRIKTHVTPVKVLIVSPFYKKPFYRTYYVSQKKKEEKYKKILSLQRRGYSGKIDKWLSKIGVNNLYFSLGKIIHNGKIYNLDAYLFYEKQKPQITEHPLKDIINKYDTVANVTGIRDYANRKYIHRNIIQLFDTDPDNLYGLYDKISQQTYLYEFNTKKISDNKFQVDVKGGIYNKDKKLKRSNYSLIYEKKNNRNYKSVDLTLKLNKGNYYSPKQFGYMLSRHTNIPEIDNIFINIEDIRRAKQYLLSHFLFMGFEFDGISRYDVNIAFKEIKDKYKKLFEDIEETLYDEGILSQTEIELLNGEDFYGYLAAIMKSKMLEYKKLNRIFYEMVNKLNVRRLKFVRGTMKERSLSEIRLHRYNVMNNTMNDYHVKYHFKEI